MSTETMIIGWICVLPRLSEQEQRHRLKAAGAERVVVDGRRDRDRPRESWKTLLKMARPGDVVAICHGRALIDGKADASARASFFDRLGELEDCGVVVWDLNTDCRSDDRKQRDRMCAVTLEDAAKAARGANGGRPGWVPTPEQRAWAYPLWISLKIPTNGKAVAAIKAKARELGDSRMMRVTASVLAKEHRFGPSGRAAFRVERAKAKAKKPKARR